MVWLYKSSVYGKTVFKKVKTSLFPGELHGKKGQSLHIFIFWGKKSRVGNNSIMGLHDTERYKKKEKTGTYIVKAFVTNDGGCIRQMKHLNPKPPPEKSIQGWSLTQFYSGDFSQSRIGIEKLVFYKRTIKVCVSCFRQCSKKCVSPNGFLPSL